MRKRRPRNPCVPAPTDDEVLQPPPRRQRTEGTAGGKKKKKKKNHVEMARRDDAPSDNDSDVACETDLSCAEIEQRLQFCCCTCKCPLEKRHKFHEGHPFIQAQFGNFMHRRCCHATSVTDTFAGPYEMMNQELSDMLLGEKEIPSATIAEKYSKSEVHKMYTSCKRQEAKLHNQDKLVDPASLLNKNQRYVDSRKWFRSLVMEANPILANSSDNHPKPSCVVLDVFAGIGTGLVVLKKLGIAVKEIIHCEHDKVATHVYRYNHDRKYNPQLSKRSSDGIQHSYYERFETIEENLDDFMKKHAPIDLAIGGPPCVDFSGANAARQGLWGDQGSYMVRFGELIQKIQRHSLQKNQPLFFLAENVRITGNDITGDLNAVKQAFRTDWDPIELDAKYVSPCIRDRTFFTNLPFEHLEFNNELSMVTPTSCLKDGYKHAGNLIEGEDFPAKCWTFMASKSKIDDDRMLVFKEDGNGHFLGRRLDVEEREALMGYPRGYVSKSVPFLFKKLIEGLAQVSTHGKHWKQVLDEQYHHFNGAYHDRADAYEITIEGVLDSHGNTNPEGQLKMMPRSQKTGKFDACQYSKRLLGNAYSIPVVAHLLSPLRQLFAKRKYSKFQYAYPWEEESTLQAEAEEASGSNIGFDAGPMEANDYSDASEEEVEESIPPSNLDVKPRAQDLATTTTTNVAAQDGCPYEKCQRYHPRNQCCVCRNSNHIYSNCWFVIGLPEDMEQVRQQIITNSQEQQQEASLEGVPVVSSSAASVESEILVDECGFAMVDI